MIGFLPKIYDDELCYSWFARYYCHSGYAAYGYALDDLFQKREIHFNAEFIDRLNGNAIKIIENIMPMEELILNHTMFPAARFTEHSRLQNALECMARQEGDSYNLLPLPKSKFPRFLRYCPCCATEQREKFGEAFWTRKANINNIGVCAKHKCRLKETGIALSGKQPPRLHIAEQVIKDLEAEYTADGLELQFAKYLTEAFQAPINKDNEVSISDFLKSKLEGTKYLSTSGRQRNISLFYNDFMGFYKDLPNRGITELPQLQKIFMGYRSRFYEICQTAFFIGISAADLTNPALPDKSQIELFQEKVAELKEAGMSSKKIAELLEAGPHTVQRAGTEKPRAEHNHAVRKGMQKEDWTKIDEEMLPRVKEICRKMYGGDGGMPKKVSANAVENMLGMPAGRLDYLPRCRDEIKKYEEPQGMYWARKVVWKYKELEAEGAVINYSKLCKPLNLKKENFILCLPFLHFFAGEEDAERIRGIVQR